MLHAYVLRLEHWEFLYWKNLNLFWLLTFKKMHKNFYIIDKKIRTLFKHSTTFLDNSSI